MARPIQEPVTTSKERNQSLIDESHPAAIHFARQWPEVMNGLLNAVREQERNAVIERAEQACRYALKRQEFCDSSPGYRDGWETAAEVCEAAIRPHVERHTKDGVTT